MRFTSVSRPLLRTLTRYRSPRGRRAQLSVLIFHRVLAQPDPMLEGEPTAGEFELMLQSMRSQFNILSLSDAVSLLARRELPERSLAITFDDGYANNDLVARPILQRLGLPATFFIATGYLDGGIMFNDAVIETVRQVRSDRLDVEELGLGRMSCSTIPERRTVINKILAATKSKPPIEREKFVESFAARLEVQLPRDLMMRSEQVTAMHRSGMEIGAHTATHPILTSIPLEEARNEIVAGRNRLEELIDQPITQFAYPNGRPFHDYGPEHVELVRKLGFAGAASTAWGSTGGDDDLHQIRRFTPWDRDPFRFGLRMVRNISNNSTAIV